MAVPRLPPRELRPLVCRYKPCTQNGNWFEDRYRKDDCVRDFLRRRERGELMIQASPPLDGNWVDVCQKHVCDTFGADGAEGFADGVVC